MMLLALRNFTRASASRRAAADHYHADLAAHLTMSLVAIGLFLMFLSVPSHKYLWMMLALSSVLVRQAAEAPTTAVSR